MSGQGIPGCPGHVRPAAVQAVFWSFMMLSRSQCVHISRLRAVAFDIDGERVFCGSLIGIGILYILHIFPRQNHHMSPR